MERCFVCWKLECLNSESGDWDRYRELDSAVNEADLPNAKAALDQVVIPDDTVDRIGQLVSPRSSLIISDEGPSSKTGRGTQFVIIMSDEPQGGLAHSNRDAISVSGTNLVASGSTGVLRSEMRIPLGRRASPVRSNWPDQHFHLCEGDHLRVDVNRYAKVLSPCR